MARTLSRRGLRRKSQRNGGVHRLQRVAGLAPGRDAAAQRPRTEESHLDQKERRPGARDFVGSIAGEDDLPLARDALRPAGQVFAQHPVRAADGLASRGQLAAQVDDEGRIGRTEPGEQIGGLDARHPQRAQDPRALRHLPGEPHAESDADPEGEKAAEPHRDLQGRNELQSRRVSGRQEDGGEQRGSCGVQKQEAADRQRGHSGKGRRDEQHQIAMLDEERGHRPFDAAWPFSVLWSVRKWSSKKANTRCQSLTCREGSEMMWVIPASGRKSKDFPARKRVSESRSDSLKCTLSSAVPWTMRRGLSRSLAYWMTLLRG